MFVINISWLVWLLYCIKILMLFFVNICVILLSFFGFFCFNLWINGVWIVSINSLVCFSVILVFFFCLIRKWVWYLLLIVNIFFFFNLIFLLFNVFFSNVNCFIWLFKIMWILNIIFVFFKWIFVSNMSNINFVKIKYWFLFFLLSFCM